jgi:Xaa-Pro aminopeptidase
MLNSSPQAKRLSDIRDALKRQDLDALIVPRFDAHMAEYVADCDKRLMWATGFSGSAGLALITQDQAILFVDGRYTVQVREQCPEGLFSYRHLHDQPLADWLKTTELRGLRIGFDPMHIPASWHQELTEAAAESHNHLIATEDNIINQLWTDRPAAVADKARPFGEEKSGEHAAIKRQRIAAHLVAQDIDVLVENQPDNIAWLLNIRGNDIAYNPFINSFLTLDREGAVQWFVDPQKVPQDLTDFELDGVEICAPERFLPAIADHAASDKVLGFDPLFTPVAVQFAAGESSQIKHGRSAITLTKAIKNATELGGMRDCHKRDGIAWTELGAWLHANVAERFAAGDPITELKVTQKIEQLRAQLPGFEQLSFDVISGAGPNGAMCHYKVTKQSNRALDPNEIYLHDSGGQFADGTTDSTRTYNFSKTSPEFCENYTGVLRGFLALAILKFPQKTFGHHIDAIARAPLWSIKKDYDHGTGHGVGHNLSVHEQPQRIGRAFNDVELVPGMVLSIEPGYYVAGEYGIRIENLFEIIDLGDGFYGFETLSYMPIETSAVLPERLTATERAWLNAYHQKCFELLKDQVSADALDYLKRTTQAI